MRSFVLNTMTSSNGQYTFHNGNLLPCSSSMRSKIGLIPCEADDFIQLKTSKGIRADYVSICSSHNHNVIDRRLVSTDETNIIVVIPSIDLDREELRRMCGFIEKYEERQLYHLLLLSDPSFRIIFVSSHQVDMESVNYFLHLQAPSPTGVKDMLSRLYIFSVEGSGCEALSTKLLKNERMLQAIGETVQNLLWASTNPTKTCFTGLSVFTGSRSIDSLSNKLKLRLLESSGEMLYFGSKQGSREVFSACNIPHPPGTPDRSVGDDDLLCDGLGIAYTENEAIQDWALSHRFIRTPESLAIGIARQIILKHVRPSKWVIKLNQGFSGKGNASINLQDVQKKVVSQSINEIDYESNATQNEILLIAKEIEKLLPQMKFECKAMTWNGCGKHKGFKDQMLRLGVIAEAFLDGENNSSPSVQALIEPTDMNGIHSSTRSLLSTHEQILNGQVYEGCINPASKKYRDKLIEYCNKISKFLSQKGVVGHFGIDFLAGGCCSLDYNTSKSSINEIYAIEINLRQGGTTHPYSTMALLCGGETGEDGLFRMHNGESRCYVATDSYKNNNMMGVTPAEFLRAIHDKMERLPEAENILWNNEKKVGVVFHLLCFVECGQVGWTAIESTPEKSKILFESTRIHLDALEFVKS